MKSFKLYFTLVLLIPLNTLQAKYFNMPFQLAGKLIIIRATVDGQAGNFILDTGISDLMLNSRYFEGEISVGHFNGLNGQGESIKLSRYNVQIGVQDWGKLNAKVVQMQAIEHLLGIPLHGLFGTDIFRNYTLLIDYQKLEIECYPLDRKGENSDFARSGTPDEVLAFKYKGGTPLVALRIGGTELKLTLDTGAEVNLFADKYLEELAPLIGPHRQQRFCGFGREGKEATFAYLSGVHTTLREVEPMNTAFTNLSDYNRYVAGPKADGIMGYEFLHQFRVAFNFRKREVYLWEIRDGLMVGNEK